MKVTNKYIGALLLGLGLAGMQSCSDSWDDHYAPADPDVATSTETLWEIISKDPSLSKFVEVAKKAHYYRDEKHPQADYTYSTMFGGTQLITVWAPTNDALTEAQWQRWNEFAENGMGYTVQQQLMANSIALWRNIANGGGIDTLAMLNGKKVPFDKTNATIAGLEILEKNIAASNGTLHKVGKALPFTYNLYEYLKDVQNENVSKFHEYVLSKDTTYFNEYGSIEGVPDLDGNPTYVDSAYTTSNAMFFGTHRFPANGNDEIYDTYDESFGANIIGEDSCFVMLIPTDKAWEDAFSKLEKYYNYAPTYVDKKKQQEQEIADGATAKDFREIDADSLKQKCITMDITSPLCFNVNLQPNAAERLGQWTAEDLLDNIEVAPYLRNTFGDTLRTDANWQKSSLFQGERVKMSNGYGIISDTWNIPAKLYKPDVIVEVGWGSLYNTNLGNGSATPVDFSNDAARTRPDSLGVAWIDTTGVVSNNNFYYLKPTNESSSPVFTFKLEGTGSEMENDEAEVMSGKYDIYVVMVPNFYITSTDTIDADPKKHLKHKISATLYYNKTAGKKDDKAEVKDIEYAGEKVEELLLFEDFEFPYSYKNLRYCYPTLTLTAKSNNNDRKNGYSNDFCIDRIILKSKD